VTGLGVSPARRFGRRDAERLAECLDGPLLDGGRLPIAFVDAFGEPADCGTPVRWSERLGYLLVGTTDRFELRIVAPESLVEPPTADVECGWKTISVATVVRRRTTVRCVGARWVDFTYRWRVQVERADTVFFRVRPVFGCDLRFTGRIRNGTVVAGWWMDGEASAEAWEDGGPRGTVILPGDRGFGGPTLVRITYNADADSGGCSGMGGAMTGIWGTTLDAAGATGPGQVSEAAGVYAEDDEAGLADVLCLLRRGPHVDAWSAHLADLCRGAPYACGSDDPIDVTPPEDPPPGQDLGASR